MQSYRLRNLFLNKIREKIRIRHRHHQREEHPGDKGCIFTLNENTGAWYAPVEDIEPIKQLIDYYRNKKQSGQPIHIPKLQSPPTSSEHISIYPSKRKNVENFEIWGCSDWETWYISLISFLDFFSWFRTNVTLEKCEFRGFSTIDFFTKHHRLFHEAP